MTCTQVEPELVAYHFGLVEGDARTAIEEHLASCGACLRAFMDIKRAIETSEDAPAPSQTSRARLRRAVANEVAPPGRRRWELPVAFAAAAALVFVARATTHGLTSAPATPPYGMSAIKAPK
jgi:anti-sigma factor RsiW